MPGCQSWASIPNRRRRSIVGAKLVAIIRVERKSPAERNQNAVDAGQFVLAEASLPNALLRITITLGTWERCAEQPSASSPIPKQLQAHEGNDN